MLGSKMIKFTVGYRYEGEDELPERRGVRWKSWNSETNTLIVAVG